MFHLYCPINDSIQSGVLDESKEYCIFAEKVNGEIFLDYTRYMLSMEVF